MKNYNKSNITNKDKKFNEVLKILSSLEMFRINYITYAMECIYDLGYGVRTTVSDITLMDFEYTDHIKSDYLQDKNGK